MSAGPMPDNRMSLLHVVYSYAHMIVLPFPTALLLVAEMSTLYTFGIPKSQ